MQGKRGNVSPVLAYLALDRLDAPAQVRFINLPGGHDLAPLQAAARNAFKAPRPTRLAGGSSGP